MGGRLIVVFLFFLFGFLITYFLVPEFICRLGEKGILAVDQNKKEKPKIPEMGGLSVISGFFITIFLFLLVNYIFPFFDTIKIISALLAIAVINFIGFIDDLLGIPQKYKAVLPFFAAVPLIVLHAYSSTIIHIPFLGPIDFGWIYVFILIPIGITGASNSFNMLAGFNGFETGMGIIITLTSSIIALHLGAYESFIINILFTASLIAFLFYNKYKAKIFPGDTLTLTIGGILAITSIMGDYEFFAALLLIPYILEFFVKLYNGLPGPREFFESMELNKEGKICAKRVVGVAHILLKLFNCLYEKQLVLVFYLIEMFIALFVLFLVFY